MSKKEYVQLARLLKAFRAKLDNSAYGVGLSLGHELDVGLIVPLAHMLKGDNRAFDYARFLAACGVVATERCDAGDAGDA